MIDHLESLREFNKWRRGEGDSAKYDEIQKTLGISIDSVIAEMERLRVNERARIATIQRWAAERVQMAAELKRLRKLATCGCGDGFTEHDPGTCGNCVAGMRK